MTDPSIRQVAELLVAARTGKYRLDSLPEALRPRSVADAFAIQDAVLALLDQRVGGWKVGLSPDGEGTAAPLFAALIHASPLEIPAEAVPLLGVEGEIAVRIGRDLPPQDKPYDRAEILDAIDAVCPAIEIVDSRFRDYVGTAAEGKLADNLGNGGFVYGAPVSDWRGLDLTALPVRLTIGGKTFTDKIGGHPSGDPIKPVIWLANHLTGRNGGLKAGQIVTTGSCTGMPRAQPGDTVIVTFEHLGSAQVTFTR